MYQSRGGVPQYGVAMSLLCRMKFYMRLLHMAVFRVKHQLQSLKWFAMSHALMRNNRLLCANINNVNNEP